MPTERRVLGQTQHTEQIPLAGTQQLNTVQTTQQMPATSTTYSTTGLGQNQQFVQTSTLPASGFVSSTEKFTSSSAALPVNTATTGFATTSALPVNTGFATSAKTTNVNVVNQSLGTTTMSSNRVVEQPILENVVERTFIEKRNLQNITEIHEQPVYEIHEKPIIENITAAAEVKRFGGQLLHEDVRQDQGFVLPAKSTSVHRTKEEYVAQVNEAPHINVQHQKIVNIIEQPLITEIVNKPIVEINETNIERVIHERPIVTVVREQAITENVQNASFATTGYTQTTTTTQATAPRTMNVTTTDTLIEERTTGEKSASLPGGLGGLGTTTSTTSTTGRRSIF